MCVCDPSDRRPWCGKPGCRPAPKAAKARSVSEPDPSSTPEWVALEHAYVTGSMTLAELFSGTKYEKTFRSGFCRRHTDGWASKRDAYRERLLEQMIAASEKEATFAMSAFRKQLADLLPQMLPMAKKAMLSSGGATMADVRSVFEMFAVSNNLPSSVSKTVTRIDNGDDESFIAEWVESNAGKGDGLGEPDPVDYAAQ